jgi:hypothetical protein
VCFLCQRILLANEPVREEDIIITTLPSAWEKSLTSFFTSIGMKPKTGEQYYEIEGAEKEPEAASAEETHGERH